MADTGGTIRFNFDGDLTGLQRSLNQAANMAKTGGRQMNSQFASGLGVGGRGALGGGAGGFEEGLISAFTKPRGVVRAERVLGRTINQLVSGDIAGAVGTVGGRIGGVGLGTVLAIDAAIQGYQKLASAMEAVQERRLKFTELTSGVGASGLQRSSGEIQSNLSGVAEQMDVLRKGFIEEQLDPVARLEGKFTHGERMEEMAGLRKQASSDITAMATRQDKLNEAEAESLFGSKRKAELLKEQEKHMANVYQIAQMMARTGVQNPAAMAAENERNRLTELGINRQSDVAEAAQQSTIRLAKLHKESPFETEALKRAGIHEKLGLISKEMAAGPTAERKGALTAERLGLESEEEIDAFEEWRHPRRAATLRRRAARETARFATFRASRRSAPAPELGDLTTGPAAAAAASTIAAIPPPPILDISGRGAPSTTQGMTIKDRPLTKDEMDTLLHKYWGK